MTHQPPPDPFTVLGSGMAQLHELYVGACEAGFTPSQAFELARVTFVESMRLAHPCPHCGRVREG